jgi:hypothetical protein
MQQNKTENGQGILKKVNDERENKNKSKGI